MDEWYDDWISADRSVESDQTYLRFLTHLSKVLAVEDKTLADATQADLKKFLRHIGEDRKAATRAYHTRVIRSFCNWLQDEYDVESPAQKIKLPKQPLTEVRSISDEDLDKLRKLLSPRKPTWTDRRDLAIIETLAASGMRIGECVAVQMEHLDLEAMTIYIPKAKTNEGRTSAWAVGWRMRRPVVAAPITHQLSCGPDRCVVTVITGCVMSPSFWDSSLNRLLKVTSTSPER